MSAVTVMSPAAPADPESAESWAPIIQDAWGATVRGVIETGRLLAQAKASVVHGDWGRLCDELLPFGQRMAQQLMQIAAHERLSNPNMCSHLPPSWTALRALAALDVETFDEAVEQGVISPSLQERQAKRLARAGSVTAFLAAPEAPPSGTDADENEDALSDEDRALESADALVRSFMTVRLPVGGLSREAAAMIEAVATCARCSTEALWRADGLRGPERKRAVTARRMAIYMLHTECGMSQPEACRPFGLEPSGASYMAKEFEDYRDDGSKFERLIERIEATQSALLEDGSFE